MTTPKAPNPSRRSENSRRAILTAAYDLLLEVGYAKLTIEAIAARAGVGKQTIYRWWSSKGAVLLDAIVFQTQGEDGGIDLPDSGDIEADLRIVLRATVEEFQNARLSELTRALVVEVQNDPALAEDMLVQVLGPQLEATKERLVSAQRAGQLAADLDLSVAVELLFGPVFHRWLLRTAPLSGDYADTVARMALRAMRAG